jgi:mono/diheme cytochrome c family protein
MVFRFVLIAPLGLLGVLGISAAGAVLDPTTVSAQQETSTTAASSRTQWDAVYTEEQAKRGEDLYTKSCGSCHGTELTGTDKGPPVVGAIFDANYDGKKMGDLSERIRTTMPVDNPGSLTRAQNADVLSFMLHKAGAPAGTTNLPTNVDQLNSIKYAAKKPAAN